MGLGQYNSGMLALAGDAGGYDVVGILVVVVVILTAAILVLAHLVGPRRRGPLKDDTYESGMQPVMGARQRFQVGFYLVAVMYVVMSVEVVFLYPWAVLLPQLRAGLTQYQAAQHASAASPLPALAESAGRLATQGYTPGFMLAAAFVFFLLILVGFVYEWRKGVFQWD